MGNHEFNAICYDARHPETGSPLREHSDKNTRQHVEFLKEFPLDIPTTLDVIAWFKTLPLFLELETSADLNIYEVDDESDEPQRHQFSDCIRIVHACWDQSWVDFVKSCLGDRPVMDDDFLIEAAQEGTEAFQAVERLLKGAEIALPEGASIIDTRGHARRKIRVSWWKAGRTYRDVTLPPPGGLNAVPDLPLPDDLRDDLRNSCYTEDAPPVFFGHYRLSGDVQPQQQHNVACLD